MSKERMIEIGQKILQGKELTERDLEDLNKDIQKSDSQIFLETMERTRKMIQEDTQNVEKSFLQELEKDLERTKPSRFFETLFLLLLTLSILGYLNVSLYVFIIIYLIPFSISFLTISFNRFSEFLSRKLTIRKLKKKAKRLAKEKATEKQCCGDRQCFKEE